MHVYVRQEVVDKTRAFTINVGCAEPMLVWDPEEPYMGVPMTNPRVLAEACADTLAALLKSQYGGDVCRCKAAPGDSVAPCGTFIG